MVRKFLPNLINKKLFGDRKKFGTKINPIDEDWKTWQKNYLKFYTDNQKGSIGTTVNHYGFKIVENIDFNKKNIVEIGPGIIEHIKYNQSLPKSYSLVDIDPQFLKNSKILLEKNGYSNVNCYCVNNNKLPFKDNSIDIVLTFHQLEHVYDLTGYLLEIKRILKPKGLLIGSVPTEGSFAWGFGRFLTSRRYVIKNMNFNYDKIICWEHPNYIDFIKKELDKSFKKIKSIKKPFNFLPFDFNLSYSFIYEKE